jgi:hypothetical protein
VPDRRIVAPPPGVRVITSSGYIDTSRGDVGALSGGREERGFDRADRGRDRGEPALASRTPGAPMAVVSRPPPEPQAPLLTKRQFEQEYQRLLREFDAAEENPGSHSCEGCRQCASCMFCKDCEECYRCTHCEGCKRSAHLTHCQDCVGCNDCAYCIGSEDCSRSNYLVLSRSCSECTYCFGCVGLAKADFHVLNVKYTRSEYFRITKALRAELRLPE